ncbi:MAG: hypothetical protein Q9166_007320 [cf. Caloplaca sp. 2 TL-2023]
MRGLGFAVVSEVSNTALSALNAVIGIVKETPVMVTEVARAAGNLTSFTSGQIAPPPQAAGEDQAESVTSASASTAFPNANDPAYQRAFKIDELVSALNDLISKGLDQGIQESDKAKLTDCLRDVEECLLSLHDNSQESLPYRSARGILETCKKIGDEILENQSTISDLNDTAWKNLLGNWKTRIEKAADDSPNLKSQASAQPGRAYGQVKDCAYRDKTIAFEVLIQYQAIPKLKIRGPIDTQGLLAQSQNDLLIKQRAMLAMQANYDKSAKRFADNQASIMAITAELRQLKDKKATIRRIRAILLATIKSVGEMQTEIRRLDIYFDGIQTVIKFLHQNQCTTFVETIKHSKPKLEDRDPSEMPFTEMQAQFYSEISRKYLLPAVHQVSALPIDSTSQEDRDHAANLLYERTKESAKAIQDIGAQKMNVTVQRLQREIKEIEGDLQQNSVLSQGRRRAIAQGAQQVQKIAAEGIQNRPLAAAPVLDLGDL